MTTALSGIKPTGTLHLDNYIGMIRPTLILAARSERSFIFIADAHALNTQHDPVRLRDLARVTLARVRRAVGFDVMR